MSSKYARQRFCSVSSADHSRVAAARPLLAGHAHRDTCAEQRARTATDHQVRSQSGVHEYIGYPQRRDAAHAPAAENQRQPRRVGRPSSSRQSSVVHALAPSTRAMTCGTVRCASEFLAYASSSAVQSVNMSNTRNARSRQCTRSNSVSAMASSTRWSAVHRVTGLAAEVELAEVTKLGAALGLDARRDFRGEAEQHVAGLFDGLHDHQLFLRRRVVQQLREAQPSMRFCCASSFMYVRSVCVTLAVRSKPSLVKSSRYQGQ